MTPAEQAEQRKAAIIELMQGQGKAKRSHHRRNGIPANWRRRGADEAKRTVAVSMRLTPDEAEELDRRRGKWQRGAFLRESLLRNKWARIPQIPPLNAAAYAALARAAANLNQISHLLNLSGGGLAAGQARELYAALQAFRLALVGAEDERHEG